MEQEHTPSKTREQRYKEQEERTRAVWEKIGQNQMREHIATNLAQPDRKAREAEAWNERREAIRQVLQDKPTPSPHATSQSMKVDGQEASKAQARTKAQGLSI